MAGNQEYQVGAEEPAPGHQGLSRAGGSAAAYTVEREPPQLFRRAGAPDPEVPLRAVDGKNAVLFGCFRNCSYLCSMKKEFGKWLMDVAKYMVTALLLSTIFADLNEPIIIYIVVILSIVVLIIGLLLVSDVHLYEDKSITNKKKGQKK